MQSVYIPHLEIGGVQEQVCEQSINDIELPGVNSYPRRSKRGPAWFGAVHWTGEQQEHERSGDLAVTDRNDQREGRGVA